MCGESGAVRQEWCGVAWSGVVWCVVMRAPVLKAEGEARCMAVEWGVKGCMHIAQV